MLDLIHESTHWLRDRTGFRPEIAIVLGSGLGGLADKIEQEHAIQYASIPHFPVPTVEGHGGRLILGTLGGRRIAAMQGRFHYYEGYSLQQIAFPIRVLRELGAGELILSNASGGVNPDFRVGDLMIIEDHISLLPANPLTGRNEDHLGPRFPDMSAPYDPDRIARAERIAEKAGIRCHTGVYAAVSGPCYETPAEYRYIRAIGADAVGMSTVPEAITARHMRMPCFAVSVITDLGGDAGQQEVTHEEVIRVASAAEANLTRLVKELIAIN
jgi:purine-nucleoside phosphorylase